MSGGKHAAGGVLARERNDRRVHLEALQGAVEARRELACGLVERRGVSWVSVAPVGGAGRMIEIGCDFVQSAWRFTWSDGRPIAPAENVEGVLAVLVRELSDA